MRFADPGYLWYALLAIPLAALFLSVRKPTSRFSTGRFLMLHKHRVQVSTILEVTLFMAVVVAVFATAARPQLAQTHDEEVIVARDIVAIVDKSGSMKETISDPDQLSAVRNQAKGDDAIKAATSIRKIDGVRVCLQYFVPMRPHDRIALFEFDANTYVNWPLSPDHEALLAEVAKLGDSVDGSTNFEGPTESEAGTGCFQGGINHFREMQPGSTSRFLIILTDGEVEAADGLDKRRFLEIVSDLKALGIMVIIVGVGDSWTADPETDPKGKKTKDLRRLIQQVNGRVFSVGDSRQMKAVFKEISDSAPSEVRMERIVEWRDIYAESAQASCGLVALLIVYSCLIGRRL